MPDLPSLRTMQIRFVRVWRQKVFTVQKMSESYAQKNTGNGIAGCGFAALRSPWQQGRQAGTARLYCAAKDNYILFST
jgi:hypothetical protein